jgi:hypothetical protein
LDHGENGAIRLNSLLKTNALNYSLFFKLHKAKIIPSRRAGIALERSLKYWN